MLQTLSITHPVRASGNTGLAHPEASGLARAQKLSRQNKSINKKATSKNVAFLFLY